ncbi:hypothetical protein OH77DRAFT_1415481 [Trametes cingulata]|nr:hypothetical protein OH77DRAFT_1415481 [Trametes cingulata]
MSPRGRWSAIPPMRVPSDHLDHCATNEDLVPVVLAAGQRGHLILMVYCKRAARWIAYRIAMVLYPARKKQYFRPHSW